MCNSESNNWRGELFWSPEWCLTMNVFSWLQQRNSFTLKNIVASFSSLFSMGTSCTTQQLKSFELQNHVLHAQHVTNSYLTLKIIPAILLSANYPFSVFSLFSLSPLSEIQYLLYIMGNTSPIYYHFQYFLIFIVSCPTKFCFPFTIATLTFATLLTHLPPI